MKQILLSITLFFCISQTLYAQKFDTLFYKADLNIDKNTFLIITLEKVEQQDTILYLLGSPMQIKEKIAPSKVKYMGDTLSLGFKQLNAVIKINQKTLQGTFKQGALRKDIRFEKQDYSFSLKRPQTPLPPFPYESKELTFSNPESDYVFHGTLTFPKEKGKYPLVVLVSGSGCQNRDEEIFGHKPFSVIADFLSRNGIAVFRYDDRGWGEKEERMYKGTTMDFAQDALCAINKVKQESIVDTNNIGIIGHSEGGMIAQILANEVDFIIMMAAPATSGKNILISQGADFSNYSFDTTKINDYWLKYFYNFEPKDYLTKIKVPTLVLQGGKDHQVFSKENIPRMQEYLSSPFIKEYPNLNHLFQNCETGQLNEYALIEETIDKQVLKDIFNFIIFLKK